jgi:uncharacterized protein YqeY
MSLLDQLRQDLTASMKARDAARTQALRLLIADLQKEATMAKPADDLAVLRRAISRSQEAEDAFNKGGATDRAETERLQAEVFRAYLPAQLSDDELNALVDAAVQETGATSAKQMGQVMKAVQPRIAGRAENARVADAVKRRLG